MSNPKDNDASSFVDHERIRQQYIDGVRIATTLKGELEAINRDWFENHEDEPVGNLHHAVINAIQSAFPDDNPYAILWLTENNFLLEDYKEVAERLKTAHKERSSVGGSSNKRRVWADRAAELVSTWDDLPESHNAYEFDDLMVNVYRDGNTLCAADMYNSDAEPKTLARSTFEKRYLKK